MQSGDQSGEGESSSVRFALAVSLTLLVVKLLGTCESVPRTSSSQTYHWSQVFSNFRTLSSVRKRITLGDVESLEAVAPAPAIETVQFFAIRLAWANWVPFLPPPAHVPTDKLNSESMRSTPILYDRSLLSTSPTINVTGEESVTTALVALPSLSARTYPMDRPILHLVLTASTATSPRAPCLRWNEGFCTSHPSGCRHCLVCSARGRMLTRRESRTTRPSSAIPS